MLSILANIVYSSCKQYFNKPALYTGHTRVLFLLTSQNKSVKIFNLWLQKGENNSPLMQVTQPSLQKCVSFHSDCDAKIINQ